MADARRLDIGDTSRGLGRTYGYLPGLSVAGR